MNFNLTRKIINSNLILKTMDSNFTKKAIFIALFSCALTSVSAQQQQKIGNNSFSINSAAALEIESTTKGFLMPRMTTTDRVAILPLDAAADAPSMAKKAAAKGLQVYDTVTTSIWTYNGATWVNTFSAALAESFVFVGNATGVATAVALTGDVKISNTGVVSIREAISTKTAAYTALLTDQTLLCNTTSAAFTLTLPAPDATATVANNVGKVYVISKIDEGSNVLTFSPALYISATSTVTTLNFVKSFRVKSDGTNWYVIN